MRAQFVSLEWENTIRTIASFYFQPIAVGGEARYRYEAGQYATLRVPHTSPDSRGLERTMTLSSSPDEPLLKFTMRIFSGADGGASGSSYKRALLGLRAGDEVTVFEAMGDLVLPLDTSVPLVFVAGGVGIASFTGMTQWLLDHQEQRSVSLFYASASSEDVVMQPVFDAYASSGGLRKQLYVRPARLTASDILPAVQPTSLVYLSGPERMIEGLRQDLQAAGVSSQQIVFDYFDGYTTL